MDLRRETGEAESSKLSMPLQLHFDAAEILDDDAWVADLLASEVFVGFLATKKSSTPCRRDSVTSGKKSASVQSPERMRSSTLCRKA